MTVPTDAALGRARGLRRYQVIILLTVAALILLVIFVQISADAYTNYLWYRSLGLAMVWRSMVETKLGLGAVFSGTLFVACWACLAVVDKVALSSIYFVPDHEFMRRYQSATGHVKGIVRTVISLVFGLSVGVGASDQWKHWLLFLNGGSFGYKDPEFGRDAGFFVFRLPFLSFLVDWCLVALVVLFVITSLAYYLNGGMTFSRPSPRIDPRAISHLSLVLAVMALVRALGYFFVDRFGLDLSNDAGVTGAGYTDVHVRLPALTILAVVCLIAFVLLTYNVYHRAVSIPIVAFGMWAFTALILGVLFPAAVQSLTVNPSESRVEIAYVTRDIAATREAYGIDDIQTKVFTGTGELDAADVGANAAMFNSLPIVSKVTADHAYRSFQAENDDDLSGVSADRYELGTGPHRTITPVVIAAASQTDDPPGSTSWVDEHLEDTHGYGIVVSPSDKTSRANGEPIFDVEGTPTYSVRGSPKVTEPRIYYGDSKSTYVIADTRQGELDYVTKSGRPKTSHYHGSGGVELSGFLQRAAYAVRFHDVNLLASNLITSKSRLIYNQNVVDLVRHAAPFLDVDTRPYPVVAGGKIYWVVDCYSTTSDFPYAEESTKAGLGSANGLPGEYNYVRESVTAVVSAYNGKVRFFASDPSDPILIAWEHAYPGMIEPMRDMAKISPALEAHLRYPQALLEVEAAMYGRYRFRATTSQAEEFYSMQNDWGIAENARGVAYQPVYELLRLPGESSLSFVAVEPLEPEAAVGQTALLTAFLTASSSVSGEGSVTAYTLPRLTSSAPGPALAESTMESAPRVAARLAALGEQHLKVSYGPPLLVPVDDSLIWLQAVYVSGPDASPALEDVIVEADGKRIGFEPTLQAALSQVFGGASTTSPASSATLAQREKRDLALAYQEYKKAIYDGEHFHLGSLQKALSKMGTYLKEAHQLAAEEASQPPPSHSTSSGKSSPTPKSSSSRRSPSSATSPSSGTKEAPFTLPSSSAATTTTTTNPNAA